MSKYLQLLLTEVKAWAKKCLSQFSLNLSFYSATSLPPLSLSFDICLSLMMPCVEKVVKVVRKLFNSFWTHGLDQLWFKSGMTIVICITLPAKDSILLCGLDQGMKFVKVNQEWWNIMSFRLFLATCIKLCWNEFCFVLIFVGIVWPNILLSFLHC